MTYRGRVKNGVVILEPGASLSEGTEVNVRPVEAPHDVANAASDEAQGALQSLRDGLLRFAGVVKGTPPDFARNHDHYLHGTPRR